MFKNVLLAIMMGLTSVIITLPTVAQLVPETVVNVDKSSDSKVTIREGQVINMDLHMFEHRGLEIINPTDLAGDVDLVAFDSDETEIDRSTIVFDPKSRVTVNPWNSFGQTMPERIATLTVLVSLRPRDLWAPDAYTVPVMFFSQIDARWKNDRMLPSSYTIGNSGCAMTSACMLLAGRMNNLTPKTMNAYLSQSSVGGYTAGGLLNWSKIPGFQPSSGVRWIGSSISINGVTVSTVKNASSLKWLLDNGYYVIATSRRFPSHFVAIYKYSGTGSTLSSFEYLDPADSGYVRHTVGDGKVTSSSGIRLFK